MQEHGESYTDPHVAAAQAFAMQDWSYNSSNGYDAGGSVQHHSAKDVTPGRRVILAHITGLKRPSEMPLGGLTLDIIHATCARFGVIDKIVCVTNPKSGTPMQCIDAMVQFESDVSAGAAMQALDGDSLTADGYNYAQVKYSKHDELTTGQNTERIRDFRAERLGIPSGSGGYSSAPWGQDPGGRTHPAGGPPDMGMMGAPPNSAMSLYNRDSDSYGSGSNTRRVALAHITSLAHPDIGPLGGLTIEALHAAFSHFGLVEKIVCSTHPKSGTPVEYVDAMVQFESPSSATSAIASFDKNSITGDGYNYAQLKYSKHTDLHAQINNERSRDFTSGAPGGGAPGGPGSANINDILRQASMLLGGGAGDGSPSAVVAVSNLDEHQAEPDVIFNLFSLYGYVVCVKILPHARHTALLQYTEPDFADLSVRYLNGSVLFNRQLQISRSEEASVTCNEMHAGDIDTCYRSYRGAVQFWAPRSEAKITANACGPSRTIFLKNLPPQVSSDAIIGLCSMYGTVVDFAFLPRKGERFITAVVQMSTVEEGIALVAMGQKQYLQSPGGENMRIMAGFSKRDQMPSSVSSGQPFSSAENDMSGPGSLKRLGDGSIYDDQNSKLMRLDSPGGGGGGPLDGDATKRVVLAHITGLARPNEMPLGGISIEVLHAVFGQCGVIEKIVCSTLPKQGTPIQYIDAMVQFGAHDSADRAIRTLDGASLTADGFFRAQMKYSKHDMLNAMANTDRIRDFTSEAGRMATPSLPALEYGGQPGLPGLGYGGESSPEADLLKLAAENPAVAQALTTLISSGGAGLGAQGPELGDLLASIAALGSAGAAPGGMDAAQAPARRVVLVHITSLRLPDLEPLGGLTIEAIHAAFSHFGPVEKIVCSTMPRNGTPIQYVDAMVQFGDPSAAAACITALDKKYLTNDGFHHVQLKFSKHLELHAQGNSDRSRDFTAGNLGGR